MNQKNQNSETYRKTNSTEHDCKTTENNRKDNAHNVMQARIKWTLKKMKQKLKS